MLDDALWAAISDADYVWICEACEDDLLAGPGDLTVVACCVRDGTLFDHRARVGAAAVADAAFDVESVVGRVVTQLDRAIAAAWTPGVPPPGSPSQRAEHDSTLAGVEPPPPEGRRLEWARPDHMLGEPVAITFLLAQSATAAVKVQHITAYPTGFEFQVVAHFVATADVWDPMHGLAGLRGRPGDGGRLSDEHLRLRIRFADGSEADNLGPPMRAPSRPGPFLQYGAGGAGRSMAETTFWLWPLPPPGPVTFVCEWPRYGIPRTTYSVDADLIREAASRATDLWPPDGQGDE